MSKKSTLKPIRPSAAIERAYQNKLMKLIDDMTKSAQYWIKAAYKKQVNEIVFDEIPADELTKVIRKRLNQWLKQFSKNAENIAKWFVNDTNRYTFNAFSKRYNDYLLRRFRSEAEKSGFTIEFKLTPRLRNTLKTFINENVNLIKSIPQKYFTDIEGIVMRSVRNGRDLAYLTEELQKRYNVTRSRAILIAHDQNNKATEQINRARQLDLGITQGIWRHSAGVKEPRHSHVKADGKIFDLKTGLKIDGEYIQPGEEINCHCTFEPIIKEFN